MSSAKTNFPEAVIVTGMEKTNPRPLLIKRLSAQAHAVPSGRTDHLADLQR